MFLLEDSEEVSSGVFPPVEYSNDADLAAKMAYDGVLSEAG